jgi:hypothetical protein
MAMVTALAESTTQKVGLCGDCVLWKERLLY